jgi:hypothetical protein
MGFIRHAARGETAWHVLRHNFKYQPAPLRHRAYAAELGLERETFPSELARWQQPDLPAMLQALVPRADGGHWAAHDIGHAIRYAGLEPWSLGDVSLRNVIAPNFLVYCRRIDRMLLLNDHELATHPLTEDHDPITRKLEAGERFEPLILIVEGGRPSVFEGAHRASAGYDWLLKHPDADLDVPLYYPCAQAAALHLP